MNFTKYLILIAGLFLGMTHANKMLGQTTEKALKVSLQTDLIAYSSPGGWSAWFAVQHHQKKLSFAYVNFPNRYREIYDETGIKELDRFARIQLAHYFNPDSKLRNFFYGANVEYHWRKLEEDDNENEVLEDTAWKLGPFIGFEWHPWRKKEKALSTLSIIPWIGINFRPRNYKQDRVFENTGNVYEIPNAAEGALGLNISYTIFKN